MVSRNKECRCKLIYIGWVNNKVLLCSTENYSEINAKETKETIAKINKGKSWFFEKINKIDKLLARLIKKQRRRTKLAKLEMKMERSQQTTLKYKGS